MRTKPMYLLRRLAASKALRKLPMRKVKRLATRYFYWKQSWKVTSAVVVVLFVAIFTSYSMLHVSADTAVLVPNGDVTAGWPATGGTNDGSCATGAHCNFVDEGTTDKTSDYITTSGSTAGGEVEEYAMTSVANLKSASQLTVRIYAQTTSIGGGTADTLTVNLRVNGTLQTAVTCTPQTVWGACNATFSGSWVQSDVDSMQVYIMRNKLGSGNPNNQADTIQLANVYATLTYVPNLQVSQSAYRWFANADASAQTTFANGYTASYGGSSTINNQASAVAKASDGGYVTAGWGNFGGNDYMFIDKYDAAGNRQWRSTQGSANYPSGIVQLSNGSYAVVGYSYDGVNRKDDMLIALIDSTGNLINSTLSIYGSGLTGTASVYGRSIVATSDGGFVVTGYSAVNSLGSSDAFVAKYDNTGAQLWMKNWDGNSAPDDAFAITQTASGNLVITGSSNGDMMVAEFSSSGGLLWSRTWGGTGNDQGNAVTEDAAGNLVVVGQTASFGGSWKQAFVVKYDKSGNLLWDRAWGNGGTSTDSVAYAVVATGDGGYTMAGYTDSYGAGSGDAFLAKFDKDGNLGWDETWGGTGSDKILAMTSGQGGGYVVAGLTKSFGYQDSLLMELTDSGGLVNCGLSCGDPAASVQDPTATIATPSTASSNTYAIPKSTSTPTPTAIPVLTTHVLAALNPPANAIAAGLPLATQDASATAPDEGTIFRLRLDLHIAGSAVTANQLQLKLQYAPKGGSATCSVVPTGNFNDVTTSSVISYADNPLASSGMTPQADSTNDPKHGTDPTIAQTYLESGTTTFTNPVAISMSNDGMWDFALVLNKSLQNTTYCMRVVQSGGTTLDSYGVYPEITTPPASFSQATYRWYNKDPAGGSLTFLKTYGTDASDEIINGIVATPTGGYAATGTAASNSGVLAGEFNSQGDISWVNQWKGSSSDQGKAIANTTDGGYVVVGSTMSYGAGSGDAFITKYNSAGVIQWNRTWGGPFGDNANAVTQTSDGGFAMTGRTISSTDYGFFVVKYDSSGTLQWSKTWTGSSYATGYSLIQTSDGGFAVAGVDNISAGNATLIKIDSAGNVTWGVTWGSSVSTSRDFGYSLVQTSDGGYVVAGQINGSPSLTKFNSSGVEMWNKTWFNSGSAYAVVQTSDGGYAVTGSESTDYASFLSKFDASGNLSWTKLIKGVLASATTGNSLVLNPDGGYTVAGAISLVKYGSLSAFIAKYDSSGNIPGCSDTVCGSSTVAASDYSAPTSTSQATTPFTSTPSVTDIAVTPTDPGFTTNTIVASAVSVGNPLANQNKGLDLASLSPLSLRIALRVDGAGVAASGQSFKLQYAVKTNEASCQAVSTSLFADVTGSTPIAYYDDAQHSSGETIAQDANDPNDGSRKMNPQTYQESNPFTNSISNIYAGEDGTWQFSLYINNSTLKGRDFCLRIATSSGTVLNALNVADVAYAPQMQQLMRGGNWFSRAGIKQNAVLNGR